MRTRVVLALLVVALTVAGCASSIAPVFGVGLAGRTVAIRSQRSHGRAAACWSHRRVARGKRGLRQGSQPAPRPAADGPGAMPPASTMAKIAERGPAHCGSRPGTHTCSAFATRLPGNWEGFDIDNRTRDRAGDLRRPPTASSSEC